MAAAVTRSVAKGLLEDYGYYFRERLGSGQYGMVEKHEKGETAVAVKIVLRKQAGTLYWENLMPREKKCWRKMSHLHIIMLHRVLETPDQICFIMEYAQEDLHTVIFVQKKDLSSHVVKRYAFQLLTALLYMESKAWSHTDVKPENIMISTQSDIRLTDFGFAQPVSRRSENFDGTDGFRAPEICSYNKYDTVLSDVFSYGATVFYMAGGTKLMKNEVTGELSTQWDQQIGNKKLLRLLRHCLAQDPEERFNLMDVYDSSYFIDYRNDPALDNIKPNNV